jgi:hypothetical protein
MRIVLFRVKGGQMSVSKRKQKNTDFERQKRTQREKEQKKKQMRTGNLPPKGEKK